MSEFQYQNCTKWRLHHLNLLKPRSFFSDHSKVVSNQLSSNSDQEVKSYSCSNSSTKMGKKRKIEKKILGYKTGQIGTGFRDYKLGQEGLQIEATFGAKRWQIGAGISNWGKEISNWGRDYKSGKRDFKSGKRLQIGSGITYRCRTNITYRNKNCIKQEYELYVNKNVYL